MTHNSLWAGVHPEAELCEPPHRGPLHLPGRQRGPGGQHRAQAARPVRPRDPRGQVGTYLSLYQQKDLTLFCSGHSWSGPNTHQVTLDRGWFVSWSRKWPSWWIPSNLLMTGAWCWPVWGQRRSSAAMCTRTPSLQYYGWRLVKYIDDFFIFIVHSLSNNFQRGLNKIVLIKPRRRGRLSLKVKS